MAHDTGFSDAARTWDERFRAPGFMFGTEPNTWLARQRHLFKPGMKALAVADGEGRNSVWLARQGLDVTAFDISAVGVAKARELAREQGVTVDFNMAGCDDWRWQEAAYDVVAAIFVQFADPAMRTRLFANMAAALRPGGYLIVQGYTPRQIEYKTGGPGILENLYTEELLREAFAGLEIVELRMYEEELDEGERHRGISALAGLVARKPA